MPAATTERPRRHGDFSGLAHQYAKYRPGYAPSVLDQLVGMLPKPLAELDVVDVGAGTGIWTRMLAERRCRSLVAIEPNADMRAAGQSDSRGPNIMWQAGSGEATGLSDNVCDVVTMASSFHWVDFEAGTQEFYRILRPGGAFIALWNPRDISQNPLLMDIEAKLYELAPHIKRVSSGRSAFTDTLLERLAQSPYFSSVTYLEGTHTVNMTPTAYIGAWQSVNDIQVQAGPAVFDEFLAYIQAQTADLEVIESAYQTRAWVAMVQK